MNSHHTQINIRVFAPKESSKNSGLIFHFIEVIMLMKFAYHTFELFTIAEFFFSIKFCMFVWDGQQFFELL